MAQISDRDLRRLAKRYRITFKPPGSSDQWPAAHRTTFENIRALGEQRLDTFCANIDIYSNDQPWRKQTKNRAEWLAKRATQLFNQQRNEAGWRFGLENDVLQRFNFEVACLKCRARIWRSEIEAYIKDSDGAAAELHERRKNRMECRCSPEYRPLDFYEAGINPLFDDRTQELIVHDAVLRSELPKQEPDRVYGLQATTNFQKLLSQPTKNSSVDNRRPSIRETINTSPFKEGVEPLLFPFLILEAKSEKSSNGFGDIQTQTAFPIMALLKLQGALQAKLEDDIPDANPLVWFLANRGDAWRVFGCYVTADNPPRYEIIQLWDGCIMSRDDALQLLLIVDYIFDWARDVYRPSILRQLKSLTMGKAYDQVSLVSDSDIFSLGENISNWIQPPPDAVDEVDFDKRSTILNHVLNISSLFEQYIENTDFDKRPFTSLVESRLSDEDFADICCILCPISLPARRVAALIHEKTPQNTTTTGKVGRILDRDPSIYGNSDFELNTEGMSRNIILRLSANLKNPLGGFSFGRGEQECDFVIDRNNQNISNIHFRIYLGGPGSLWLVDLSSNGIVVDGCKLCNKNMSTMAIAPLRQNSTIFLDMTPPQEGYRFIVRIPQRDLKSENAYQQNLKALRLRRITFRKDNEFRETTKFLGKRFLGRNVIWNPASSNIRL